MRVAIFGDSFMKSYSGQDFGYPDLIEQYLYNNYDNTKFMVMSKSGSSHWYSYKNFLNSYKNYDIIIFGHTSSYRWPALPPELEGESYMIDKYLCRETTSQLIKDINKYYLDIMPGDFTRFISEQIFYNVNKICKDENKYLINLKLFSPDNDGCKFCPTKFPVLKGLNLVSASEQVNYKGQFTDMNYVVNKIQVPDPRACHLSKANNKILADFLIKLILEKPYNLNLELLNSLKWQKYDSHTEELLSGIDVSV